MNTLNRNVHTVIPIVSWTGAGPPMSMNLYHNSATVDWLVDLTRGMGFDLGPGWTTSFSAHISNYGVGKAVISDDGARNLFNQNGAQWDGPRGVHDVLTFDEVTQKYTLKHKDQSYDEFDNNGLLIAVVDALGNRITIQRVDGRIDTVTDAAGRILRFTYNEFFNLDKIIDPVELEDQADPGDPEPLQEREWTFTRGNLGHLSTIRDPMGYLIDMQYDSEGRIERIADKHHIDNFPGWYVYEYDIGFERDRDALRRVTDPLNFKQAFQAAYDANFSFHVNHTDKRGNLWVYDSWRGAVGNAPAGAITNPLAQKSTFQYDTDWNLLQRTDPLNNTWTYTYDATGNTLTRIAAARPAQLLAPAGLDLR
ncbi:MAG: RHS repeat protein [Candidatus Hydrogenedentes bacterium]|nr:RHS repeat protein [Candidatus Hydrogenedentota bacterium]